MCLQRYKTLYGRTIPHHIDRYLLSVTLLNFEMFLFTAMAGFGMSPEYHSALLHSKAQICSVLGAEKVRPLCTYLSQNEALTQIEVDHINNATITPYEMAERLITIIMKGTDRHYRAFVDGLRFHTVNMPELANELPGKNV